jgi:nitrogen fixation NifU-like protein
MNNAPSNSELQDLYRELILDHARKPRNFKSLDNATHTAEGINPLCGDKLRLYLCVDSENQITDIGFEGSGCAISMASASLLTETVSDLSVMEADSYFSAVTSRLTQVANDTAAATNIDLSKLKALDGVREYPSRIKCATLAWHALHAALENSQTTATTE